LFFSFQLFSELSIQLRGEQLVDVAHDFDNLHRSFTHYLQSSSFPVAALIIMAELMEVDNPLQQPLGEAEEQHAAQLQLALKQTALEQFIAQSRAAPRSKCNNYTIAFMNTWRTSNINGTKLVVPKDIYQRDSQ
jgi:hypothetical protein